MYVGSVYFTCSLLRMLSHVLRETSRVDPGVGGLDPGNILLYNISRMQGIDGEGG